MNTEEQEHINEGFMNPNHSRNPSIDNLLPPILQKQTSTFEDEVNPNHSRNPSIDNLLPPILQKQTSTFEEVDDEVDDLEN